MKIVANLKENNDINKRMPVGNKQDYERSARPSD